MQTGLHTEGDVFGARALFSTQTEFNIGAGEPSALNSDTDKFTNPRIQNSKRIAVD